ncbi:MAG: biotin transporter BioY [Eggerthellaceae bacterium]|nr:biotin transporter BioY [Eggerthellaceae bacterium]
MEQTLNKANRTRTQSVVFCGLSIALLTVSAWISIPFGPIPFTLQTFVLIFILLTLQAKEALASIGIYLVMGAAGLPVFSAMRGGIGVLAGPTGGFIWGFLLGAAVALVYLRVAPGSPKERPLAHDAVAAVLFLLVCYACGWVQLMLVANMGPAAAFLAAIAPFIIIDALKLAAAIAVARAVRAAI